MSAEEETPFPKLIVGLGNPGPAYARHRHNVGSQCLNYFARRHGLTFTHARSRARLAEGVIQGVPVVLARPQTFMNQSGQAVAPLVRRLSISLAHLLVVHDDLDLPLGSIRLRPRGSSGGHKGMESIISHLGSQEFPRLRVGIGRPEADLRGRADAEEEVIRYVLAPFTTVEQAVMEQVYPRVADALLCLLTEGIDAAMNRFN